jgi:hypothetical protein
MVGNDRNLQDERDRQECKSNASMQKYISDKSLLRYQGRLSISVLANWLWGGRAGFLRSVGGDLLRVSWLDITNMFITSLSVRRIEISWRWVDGWVDG